MEQELTKYTRENFQKQKTINRPYELRKQISEIIGRDIGLVMGWTRGWSELELAGCVEDSLSDAQKWKIKAGSRAWNILKETKNKHAKNN